MRYDQEKVDEMTLALMYLVLHGGKWGTRAWKGLDWETLDRLYEKGLIGDPKSKAKSVPVTEEGIELCERFFWEHFGVAEEGEG
jgi:hypothetical protein